MPQAIAGSLVINAARVGASIYWRMLVFCLLQSNGSRAAEMIKVLAVRWGGCLPRLMASTISGARNASEKSWPT